MSLREKLPTICPWCEHVIDHCHVRPCAAHAHLAVRSVEHHPIGCLCGSCASGYEQDARDPRDLSSDERGR